MTVADAQKEVQSVYVGGFAGLIVSDTLPTAAGVATATVAPNSFTLGGWLAAAVFFVAAFPFRSTARAGVRPL